MKNNLSVLIVLVSAMILAAGIGAPKNTRKLKRTDARVLARILEICPPLPEKSGFGIPGYKSVQCFYREKADGSLELVEDLNNPVSIPQIVRKNNNR